MYIIGLSKVLWNAWWRVGPTLWEEGGACPQKLRDTLREAKEGDKEEKEKKERKKAQWSPW